MSRTTLGFMVVAAVVAVYVLSIAPLDEKREEMQDRMFLEHKALLKYERFATGGDDAKRELETLRRKVAKLEKRIIDEEDRSLALASLQSKVQDRADDSGLKVNSVKPLEPEDLEGYRTLPLFLDASGRMGPLSSFLKKLDSSGGLISLEKINISRAPRGGLRVKMQVTGLMKQ